MAFIRRVSRSIEWTSHSLGKLRFYGLSKSRVLRVVAHPARVEEGVAENTIAFMQPVTTTSSAPLTTSKKSFSKLRSKNYELWVMAQDTTATRKIISAWRYPGTTKPGEPLPNSVLQGIRSAVEEFSL